MTTVAGKRADLAVQKAKRQRKIAIGGVVLLIGLLVFQVPRLMKHFNSSTNVPTASVSGTAPTTTAPGATVPGTAVPQPAVPSTLSDTDRVTVTPDSGQLVSFGLFKSKDPFVQQLSNTTTPVTTPTTPVSTPTVTPTSPAPTVPAGLPFPTETTTSTTTPAPVVTTPGTTTPAPTTSTPPPPTTPPGTVAIRIGGACQVVALKATFPKGVDIFRVESIGKNGSIKISVNGGTYESGAATVTLKKGSTLTLMNTADGARYVLKLASACPSTPAAGTTSTPTTPTPTSTTPSSTATTPSPTTTTTSTTPKP